MYVSLYRATIKIVSVQILSMSLLFVVHFFLSPNSNDSFPKGLLLEDVVRLYCKIKIAQYSWTHRIMRSVYIHRLHNYSNTLCSRNIKLMSILIVQKAMRCHQKIICPQEELKEFSNWLIKNFNLNPSERPKKNLNAFNHWIRD